MSTRIFKIIAIALISMATITFTPAIFADETKITDTKTAAQVDAFIDDFVQYMVDKHNFDEDYLYDLFDQVTVNKIVINRMNHPYEARPWYKYHNFFLTDERINKGVAYWQKHQATLQKAERKFGVPASIIVAILGVETDYGNRKGNFSVLESLTTLAFNYPSRASFFKKELEHFLLLTREQKLDPLKVTGSHAGAIGLPQFMPSSYRQYAVDFSGRHSIDLVNSDEDAIGSIANFLKRHGWKRNGEVAEQVTVNGKKYKQLLTTSLIPKKPKLSAKDLTKHSIKTPKQTNDSMSFFDLEGKNKNEYWVGYNNFYVISRYNRNKHYAMAVYQLSDAIKRRHEKTAAQLPKKEPHQKESDVSKQSSKTTT